MRPWLLNTAVKFLNIAHSRIPSFLLSVVLSILLAGTVSPQYVFANPVLNNISAGNVSIQQTGNTTNINQQSSKAVINWNSFNINANEATHFQQPAGGIALNRISPTQGASQIYGVLTATGQIILANPAGIFFGPSAYVNVGGIIATTADISNKNFLNGNYQFTKVPGYTGSIINQGSIVAANHGLVALVGQNVSNNGLIQANLGHIVLATGDSFTMSFAGNDMINFAVTKPSSTSGKIENTGSLIANGGSILVSANTVSNVLDNVIDMQGLAQAQGVDQQNGEIVFLSDNEAGVVRIAATLDATGLGAGEHGGKIAITGHDILVASGSNINASGNAGGGDIYIGGNYHGEGPLANANATVIEPDVHISANAVNSGNGGNVVVWSNDVTRVYGDISAQGGSESGNGGFVETSSHNYLDVNGADINLTAQNGKTGNWLLDPADLTVCAACSTSANFANNIFSPSGSNSNLLVSDLTSALASANIILQTTSAGVGGNGDILVNTDISWGNANSLTLSAYRNITFSGASSINNTGGASVVLQADNSGTGSGTVSFGTGNVALSGGSGTVSIYYNPTTFGTQDVIYAGGSSPTQYMLINQLGASTDSGGTTNTRSLATLSNTSTYWADNFALSADIDASATSGWNAGAGFSTIGNGGTLFTGQFDGQNHTISNLFMSHGSFTGLFGATQNATIQNLTLASPTAVASGDFSGVLTGFNSTFVTINNVHLTNISLTSSLGTSDVGGLVGSMADGLITNSDVSGTVTGPGAFNLGGLVGVASNGTFSNDFSTATVANAHSGAGGLIGRLSSGSVTNSYSTGSLPSNDINSFLIGGLIGSNNGVITNSYSTATVFGGTEVGGFAGHNGNSITNSYSTGNVFASNILNDNQIGGFVGSNTGTLTNVYSIGAVSGTTGPSIGGLVGKNSGGGSATNSYWDIAKSGQASSALGTGESTANMMSQATYSGWDFSGTWGIIAGQSYPYLLNFYPSTPRAVGGSSPAASNSTVTIASNGTVVGSASTYADGSFYSLFSNGAIADNTYALVYLNGAASVANAVALVPGSGGSLSGTTGLTLTANAVTVGDAGSSSISNLNLSTALGGLSTTDILYSLQPFTQNLILGNAAHSNIDFVTTNGTTYVLSGNITPTAGGVSNMTFNGPVSITAANPVLTTAAAGNLGDVVINGDIAGNGNALTIASASNNNSISGNISGLGSSGTNGLILSNTGNLTLSGNNNYAGDTVNTVTGTFIAASSSAFGSGQVDINGGHLTLSGINLNIPNQINFTNAGALFTNNNNGANILSGPITLGGTVTFNIANATETLTLANTVSGSTLNVLGNGKLALASANTFSNTSLFGNVTLQLLPGASLSSSNFLTEFTSGSTFDLNGNNQSLLGLSGVGTVTNSNNSTPVILALNNSSPVEFDGTLTGNLGLNLSGTNSFTFGGPSTLNSLIANSIVIFNGGSVTTFGNQIYNALVSLLTDTTFTSNGAASTIAFNNGINGGLNVIVNGNANRNTFILNGAIVANNINVNAQAGSTNNSLTVGGGANENWNISSPNSGTIGGVATSGFSFSNIQNLTGGSGNNTFALNSTLSGSINGGSGTNNMLIGNLMTFNTWNMIGANTGYVTNLGGGFSNMQNITGGSMGNTFMFQTNGSLSGMLSGGSLSNALSPTTTNINTLDFMNYASPTVVALNTITSGTVSTFTTPSNLIVTFNNINNLNSNILYTNKLILPPGKNVITITGGGIGSINDPTGFNGYTSFTSTSGNDTIIMPDGSVVNILDGTITTNGVTMSFDNFDLAALNANLFFDVSSIIQQPDSNANSSAPRSQSMQSIMNQTSQNLDQIITELTNDYNNYLNRIKINPFCSSTT